MQNPIFITLVCSILLHVGAGLSLYFFSEQQQLKFPILPAQRVTVNLRVTKPSDSMTEKRKKPAQKKVVTTSGASENKHIVPLVQPEKTKPVKQALPVEKVLIAEKKPELKKERPKKAEPEGKSAQKVKEETLPQTVVAKDIREILVTSEVENAKVQGASSQYRLIETPRYSGRQEQPVYPYRARRMGQEGTVVLDVKLDGKGNIFSMEVETTSGHKSLDKAALKAVARWRFLPLVENGRGIPSRVKIPVKFRLR
ncbi:energy transducer TonB [Parendozoicomonas sp. Alg238-R29]|uniref:energy transducer TonB n=1 Tax=Parendozoicomonas sp. Alg238-R29 TaxID=2993446 RepID=UPI00248E86A5|nr:energy transducer TonB [Parendozoicomonas sp. Alg238-R29]